MTTPLLITGVYPDPLGHDAQPDHGEFFVVENATETPLPLGGWSVRDAAGLALALPWELQLPPRGRLRIFTGQLGGPGDCALGRRQPYLNNEGGETIELIDPGGIVRQTFEYN